MRELTADDIEITILCHPEHVPVKGNALASGDNEFDAKCERKIIRDLENGNEWAWCTAEVRGEFNGLSASDYLGCCSYRNEKDFVKNSGYYEDMVARVLADLNAHVAAILKATS